MTTHVRPVRFAGLLLCALAACSSVNDGVGGLPDAALDAAAVDFDGNVSQDGAASDATSSPGDAAEQDGGVTDDDAALADADVLDAALADGSVDIDAAFGPDASLDAPVDIPCGLDIGACPRGQFCDFPEGNVCGHGGIAGVCRTPPTIAPAVGLTCACDGQTYRELSDIWNAGLDVAAPGACPTRASCAAQSVSVTGASSSVLGFFWNGSECTALVGVLCTGVDCANLYASSETCYAAHLGCVEGHESRVCGRFGIICSETDYCEFATGCGNNGEAGECTPRPTSCEPSSTLRDDVCGCDGDGYTSMCAAQMAGTDATLGLCLRPFPLDGGRTPLPI